MSRAGFLQSGMGPSGAELSQPMGRTHVRQGIPLLALLVLLALAGPSSLPGQPAAPSASAPLPDLPVFLGEVRERLHSDEFLLDQYTFTERHTERQLDGSSRIRKVTSAVYEVYPSPEPGHTYRRLVERDGKPLSSEELAKEDRKQDEKEAKASVGSEDDQKRVAALAQRRAKEAALIEELFRVYDIRIAGREEFDGRSAILVTFHPRPGVVATSRVGKVLQKFAGRAWIDEEDRQLMRVEGLLIDDLSFGFGILAKLKKGATASLLRRKINDEIWLPAEAHFVGQARILLVKGIHVDALSEYSDYKKFSVATEEAVTSEQEKK